MRSVGKYWGQVLSSPVSRMPTYTPRPVCETLRARLNGATVTLIASWSQVLKPLVKSETGTKSEFGGMLMYLSTAAAFTNGNARMEGRADCLPAIVRPLISGELLLHTRILS